MKAHVLLTLVVFVYVYCVVCCVFLLLLVCLSSLCVLFVASFSRFSIDDSITFMSATFFYVPYYVWRVFDNVCIRIIKIKNELECSFTIYISFPSDTNKSNSLSRLYRWSFVALFWNLLILSNTISNILKQLI